MKIKKTFAYLLLSCIILGLFSFWPVRIYAENNLFVLTPNGSQVSVTEEDSDLSAYEIEYLISFVEVNYPNVELIDDPTIYYNCHSYAWYYQSINNTYWMPHPDIYYSNSDKSYVEVSDPRAGDLICYFNENGENIHSGVVKSKVIGTSNNICGTADLYVVVSKWGSMGLYEHYGEQCPYTMYNNIFENCTDEYRSDNCATYIKFYRPRTDYQATISSTLNDKEYSKSINLGSIENTYSMCDIRVLDGTMYELTFNASSQLDVVIYDSKMQKIVLPGYYRSGEYQYRYYCTLPSGRYYIRVEFKNNTNTGSITTKIGYHDTHNYNLWTYYSSSQHIECCECLAVGTAKGVHVVKQSETIIENSRPCLKCGAIIDDFGPGFGQIIHQVQKITVNGSYIRPDGIIVLVDEDVEAYFAGTLVFYEPDDLPQVE